MSGSNEKLRVLRRIPEIRFDEELRGYNKHQVDRVLENLAPLADEVDVLVDRLSEAERRAAAAEARVMESGGPAPTQLPPPEPQSAAPAAPAAPVDAGNFDETLSKTLLLAQRTADATVQEANDQAARITAEAEAEAAATREAVEQEAASMRAAAADERSASVEQANREVAAMIAAARSTIDTKVAEAEAELEASHATTRDELVEQIGSLQRSRDALALDVEHFEGHLTSRREVIRGALAELAEVVEHPERLRTVMPPTPVAEVPEVNAPEPAQIDVASLDALDSEVAADAEAQGVLAPDLVPAPDDSQWAEDGNTWADDESAGDAVANDSAQKPGEAQQPSEAQQSGDAQQASEAEVSSQMPESEGENLDDALESGLLVDSASPVADAADDMAGEPTQALPIVDGVPADEATSDPFLDELRRATSEGEDDEALSKFLDDADTTDEGKGGWFGRRK